MAWCMHSGERWKMPVKNTIWQSCSSELKEIKEFSRQTKLKESITTRPALQGILKGETKRWNKKKAETKGCSLVTGNIKV